MRTKNPKDNCFYVYVLLDSRVSGCFRYGRWVFPYEPFYVGKGKGNRSMFHFERPDLVKDKTRRSIVEKIKQKGLVQISLIKKKNLTEHQAFEKERELICRIGRRDLNLGPLTNRSNGGEGDSCRARVSQETLKLRALKRAQESPEDREARRARQSLAQQVRYSLTSESSKKRTADKLRKIQLERDPQHKEEIRKKRSKAITESWKLASKEQKSLRIERMREGRGYT